MILYNHFYINDDSIIGYNKGKDGDVYYLIIYLENHKISFRTDNQGARKISHEDMCVIVSELQTRLFDDLGNRK